MKDLIEELSKAYSLYEKSKSPIDWAYVCSVHRKIENAIAIEEMSESSLDQIYYY